MQALPKERKTARESTEAENRSARGGDGSGWGLAVPPTSRRIRSCRSVFYCSLIYFPLLCREVSLPSPSDFFPQVESERKRQESTPPLLSGARRALGSVNLDSGGAFLKAVNGSKPPYSSLKNRGRSRTRRKRVSEPAREILWGKMH